MSNLGEAPAPPALRILCDVPPRRLHSLNRLAGVFSGPGRRVTVNATPQTGRLRLLARYLQLLVLVVALHLVFLARRIGALRRTNEASWQRQYGTLLAELLQALGPLFVKAGQLLATRADLLHPDVLTSLARLHTQVRFERWERIVRVLEGAFPLSLDRVFADIDQEPVAAGAIAQVHKARLTDGRWVAVKVCRPGVADSLRVDLSIVGFLARTVQRIPPLRSVPVVAAYDVIRASLEQQTDLVREAQGMRAMARNFAGSLTVIVPEPLEGYCSESVVVMEYVAPLRRLTAQLPVELRKLLAARSLRALYQMIFTDGCIHADLHPGNLWSGSGGEVVLLDFGLVGRLDEQARMAFVEFFRGFLGGDAKACVDVIVRTATRVPAALNRAALVTDLQRVLDRSQGLLTERFQVAQFAFEMFEVQRRHRIESAVSFVTPILSLLSLEGTLKELDPELDFQREAGPFVFSALMGLDRRCE